MICDDSEYLLFKLLNQLILSDELRNNGIIMTLGKKGGADSNVGKQ